MQKSIIVCDVCEGTPVSGLAQGELWDNRILRVFRRAKAYDKPGPADLCADCLAQFLDACDQLRATWARKRPVEKTPGGG
jgi:hypothetical protein